MKLSEIWMWYCAERFPSETELPAMEPVSPWDAVELFFDLHPLFTARYDAIKLVPYDTAFDDEVDGALAHMARFDTFDGWDKMSAGAWRVMSERLSYAEAVVLANEAHKEPAIAHLPIGLDRQSRARALLLMFLLGGARSIDRRLLPKQPDGSLPSFPATLLLQKH
ncbi:hypothetical protein EHE22_26580 [Ochrobactrum pseudogrignonense]|uniref:Uncharacterized protein n=1 Tax=Brucella pseudogrignonensis TaxID=419475 RepID=A0A7Y3TAN5_9HYPH|nr:hypothetical protein [Brucella pseudogrignonensis]NNV23918.1 hypothetical protein [Brucella pseudogrignonensis]